MDTLINKSCLLSIVYILKIKIGRVLGGKRWSYMGQGPCFTTENHLIAVCALTNEVLIKSIHTSYIMPLHTIKIS